MTESTSRARLEALERLADRIARESRERDHGIAWATGQYPDLRQLLKGLEEDDDSYYPVEPDEMLISLYWNPSPAGGCARRLHTVELPCGRELLVDDFDVDPTSTVIGVIEQREQYSHLRAVQAAISGERTGDPLLVGFPDELSIAAGGVVLVDALAEALRTSNYAAETLAYAEEYWVAGLGAEQKQRLVTALEEELEEAGDDQRRDGLAELLERAESTPSWLWAIDAHHAERLTAERPPIPLYAPPGIPDSFDPAVSADDPRLQAAALLAACQAL